MDNKKEIATITNITDIPTEVRGQREAEMNNANKFISGEELPPPPPPPRTWSGFGYDMAANTASGIGKTYRYMVPAKKADSTADQKVDQMAEEEDAAAAKKE